MPYSGGQGNVAVTGRSATGDTTTRLDVGMVPFASSVGYELVLAAGVWDLTFTFTHSSPFAPPYAQVVLTGVVVTSGATARQDVAFTATAYTGPRFIGRVMDPDGNPVASVQIVGQDLAGPFTAVTDASGGYGFNAAASWNADFIPPAGLDLAAVGSGGSEVNGVPPFVQDVVLPFAGTLTGTVVGPDGLAMVGDTVSVEANAHGVTQTVTTGADGVYRIVGAGSGARQLTVTPPGASGLDSVSAPETIAPRATTVFDVSIGIGTVRGTVSRTNGGSFLRGTVTATRADGARRTTHDAPFGPDGAYRLDLVPGPWNVIVSMIAYINLGDQLADQIFKDLGTISAGQTQTINPDIANPVTDPPPEVLEAPFAWLLPATAALDFAALRLAPKHRLRA